jgi:chromatin segregation and condensation protein Rec8/ScpA/Scc1 (kleisin family)
LAAFVKFFTSLNTAHQAVDFEYTSHVIMIKSRICYPIVKVPDFEIDEPRMDYVRGVLKDAGYVISG